MRSRALQSEEGISTVEYIIILMLIAVAAIGSWKVFGGEVVYKVRASTTEVNSLGT